MSRKHVPAGVAAVVFLAVLATASPASATEGGGCELQGTAKFSPGLTGSNQNFTYSFNGALSNCQSNIPGAPTSGSVSAGELITDPTGEQFQEPVPSGSGSCESGTTSGIAIVTWADGTNTVVSYSTSAVAAAVELTGTVISSVTLQAVNPQPGQPTSKTITTTRYAGDSALGALVFQADAAQCNTPTGVTSAGISGFTGLGSA